MTRRRSPARMAVGLTFTIFGSVAALGVYAFAWLAASYGGLQYKCLVEGPFRESAPFALVSEAVEVRGYVSSWPLGRACDWERADELGFVTALPGWSATGTFVLCLAVVFVGVGLLVVEVRARRGALVRSAGGSTGGAGGGTIGEPAGGSTGGASADR